MKEITQKLFYIQQKLKAPKDKYNSFGKYKYRSAESIIESVKPLLKELNCILICNSEAVDSAHTRLVVKATLIDVDSGEMFTASSSVREDEQRAGMCASQNSGSSESFAKKYALGNLFAIDDSKDDDDDNLSPLNTNNTHNASKTNTNAPKIASKGTSKAKQPSPKAVEAWKGFCALPTTKALSDTDRSAAWSRLLTEKIGKVASVDITDAEWDKVISAIKA